MNPWMETATEVVGEIYDAFLQQVVDQGVVEERVGSLSEDNRKQVDKGLKTDTRVVRLMAISGKGGWHEDPELRKRFAKSSNVTLLDHLLSVIRGAMMLAALDWLAQNPAMDRELLARRLKAIAVIAFLHDLDKLLKLPRNTPLPLDEIHAAMQRYRLAAFLGESVSLTAEQLRYLIERVEATQTMLSPVKEPPPREVEMVTGYVALADKLDGIWLSSEPHKGGLAGVLERLQRDQTLSTDVLRHWRALEIFDPHHPFLLDELQRWLSVESVRKAGVPPLIEVHQDGRLYVLLPDEGFERIVDAAINKLCHDLPFNLELNVSNRGTPALYNGRPSHAELQDFITQLTDRDLGSLFRLQSTLAASLTGPLDELLKPMGLEPRWPGAVGATTTPYPAASELDPSARMRLHDAAYLSLLLNLKADTAATKAGLPDYATREVTLCDMVGQQRPEWLQAVSDDNSRRVLSALWSTALAASDEALRERIWGEAGVLQGWLEGTEDRAGFRDVISTQGTAVLVAVAEHFRQLTGGGRIHPADESATGRCLFTDEPVPFEQTIDEALGLYQVRVSAFSGRDGRPESIALDRSHTNVGPVSIAEHKLRAQAHARQGGKPEGVPTLISSPSTSGLFGGLKLPGDASMRGMSLYDLSRQELKKGDTYRGAEIYYKGRYRMARFERMAEKTADQVNQLRMLLQATVRIGRPIHIFRGLPTPERAFFYYDAMPRMLVDLLGANSLRLEQIPTALTQLGLAQTLLDTNGLGYDVLRLYAVSRTRFGAICLAWCHLHDRGGNNVGWVISQLQIHYLQQLETLDMSTEDGALVRLGRMAAGIQAGVSRTASANEELLVLHICMDAAYAARSLAQDDEQSLIYAVAGELETNLVRRGKAAARKYRNDQSLPDACLELAEFFVREIWNGILKRRPPSQNNRRVLSSIYRMAFLQTVRHRPEHEKPLDPADTDVEGV